MNSCLQLEFGQRGSGNCGISFLVLEGMALVIADFTELFRPQFAPCLGFSPTKQAFVSPGM
jgi:hypothetical protein